MIEMSQNINQTDTDFHTRNLDQIIRVRKCTYANDIIDEPRQFFICPCTAEDFYPICNACARNCHKDHNPVKLINDNLTCMCGKSGHKISIKFKPEVTKSARKECLFEKFHPFTDHAGYFIISNNNKSANENTIVVCSICLQFCHKESFKSPNVIFFSDCFQGDSDDKICKCEAHSIESSGSEVNPDVNTNPNVNVINLNWDFYKNYFHLHFISFNFNILDKVPQTKEKYGDFLYKKIMAIHTCINEHDFPLLEEHSIMFFTNVFVFKILELFSLLKNIQNPFFILKSNWSITNDNSNEKMLNDHNKENFYATLMRLLKIKEKMCKIGTKRDIATFCLSKIYFSEYIFNFFIRRFLNDFCVRINVTTFTNLNLFQRFLYVHDCRNFFKIILSDIESSYTDFQSNFSYYKFNEELVTEFSNALIELYEHMLRYHEVNRIDNFKQIIFLKFNKIFKDLIKYNLIPCEIRLKYFELVKDTVKLDKDREEELKTENSQPNICPYYIIKSIFFTLVYYNDCIIMHELQTHENISLYKGLLLDLNKKKFAFCSNKISNTLSLIFAMIINTMERKSTHKDPVYLKKLLKFDFYVKKIFELMICSDENNFFIESVENLKFVQNKTLVNIFSNACNIVNNNSPGSIRFQSYQDSIASFLTSNPLRAEALVNISKISQNLSNLCNDFFEYEILYPEFISKAQHIFIMLSNFLKGFLIKFPPFDKFYHTLTEDDYGGEENLKRITFLQDAVMFTNFYNSIAKFIFIYGEDKLFYHNLTVIFNHPHEDSNAKYLIKSDLLQTLLIFLFLSFKDNFQNLALFMSLSAEHFIFTFFQKDIQDFSFKFLIYLMDMLFGMTDNKYIYDNYTFYSRLIVAMCKFIRLDETESAHIDESTLISHLNLLNNLCELASKPIRFVSFSNEEIINLVDSIKRKIVIVKKSPYKEFLTNYFKQEVCLSWTRELQIAITNFLKSYFDFVNEVVQSDLYFLGKFDESKDMIYNVESLAEIIEHNFFIELFVKAKLTLSYVNLTINFKIEISNAEDMIKLIYSTYSTKSAAKSKSGEKSKFGKSKSEKFFFCDRNLSLIHLTDFETVKKIDPTKPLPELKTKFSKYLHDLNHNKSVLIKKLILGYPAFIDECNKIFRSADILIKLFKVFKYYNYLIVHPLFTLINHYLLLENDLKAKESAIIHNLVVSFLESTLILYENPLVIDDQCRNMPFMNKYVMKRLLDSEGIYVIHKLCLKKIRDVREDLINLSEHVMYFELDKIVETFRRTLFLVLDVEKRSNFRTMSMKVKRSTSGVNVTSQKKTDNNYDIKEQMDFFNEKINTIVNEYSECFNNTLQRKLSLIKVLNYGDSQNDLRGQIIDYLERKAADNLSYNNCDKLSSYSGKDFSLLFKENICNFVPFSENTHQDAEGTYDLRIENFYTFQILNYLFYHDCNGFQNSFNKKVLNNTATYEKLFLFFIEKAIFANIINECRLMCQIDLFPSRNKNWINSETNLSYEMALNSIEFMYHISENQNQVIQQILYSLSVSPATECIKIEMKDDAESGITTGGITSSLREIMKIEIEQSKSIASLTKPKAKDDSVADISSINTLKQLQRRPSGINIVKRQATMDEIKLTNKKSISSHGKSKFYDESSDKSKMMDKIMSDLEGRKYSYLNFIFLKMKLLVKHFPFYENSLFFHNRDFKNYNKLLGIYDSLFNMLIQMIQGSQPNHMDLFYKQIPTEEDSTISEYYFFLKFASDVKDLIFSEGIDLSILPIKSSFFVILNNLLSQDLKDDDGLIILCMNLFPMDDLLSIASRYLRVLYTRYIIGNNYYTEEFTENFAELELDEDCLIDLNKGFLEMGQFSQDPFFKIASQIYLFICILSEKYDFVKAKNIRNLAKENLIEDRDRYAYVKSKTRNCWKKEKVNNTDDEHFEHKEDFEVKRKKSSVCNIMLSSSLKKMSNESNWINQFHTKHSKKLIPKTKTLKTKNNYNNLIVTSKFFFDKIRSCEFLIKTAAKDKDSEDTLSSCKLKTVFFIVDPRTFLVSKSTIDKFFDEVDRSGPNSKLKGLIDKLPLFQTEIDYKIENYRETNLKILLEIDYKLIDFINFIISLLIIAIMLTTLQEGSFLYPVYSLAILQLIFNLICLCLFFKSKFFYYVHLNKKKLCMKNLSLVDNLRFYIFDCFLSTEETSIIVFNTAITLITFYSTRLTFLYTLQLLGAVKFADTIKEIATAFKLRFGHFLSMIAFLAILVNFYAMFGFFFMKDEFNFTLGDGTQENLCQSLLSCYVTYFNFGIRSSGGIGDILERKALHQGLIYWLRYFADLVFYVTVVLLVLNMINGIIISTFASIRDANEKKEEDISGRCFICSLPKVEFEKKKVSFEEHLMNEHNYYNYVRYLIALKLKDWRCADANEAFIIKCMQDRKIKFFPIGRSISLGEGVVDMCDKESEDDE